MSKITKFFRDEDGNIIVLAVAGMMAVLLCAAIAIDVGNIMTARNQLQCAVDASALAGASGLLLDKPTAVNRAIHYGGLNDVHNQAVSISSGGITFPTSEQIHVVGYHTIPLFFGTLINVATVNITAAATAALGRIIGTPGLRPWAVPDYGYEVGERTDLKIGDPNDPNAITNSGYFYPVDYPPINSGDPITGGSEYEYNIYYGTSSMVYIDDILLIEPGNMVGPTSQGVNALIAEDPFAYFDGEKICNSDYEGFTSPRIVKIPLWDPDYPPDSGRNTLEVVGLAAFWLEGIQGRTVTGTFIEITTAGKPGNGNSTLRGIRLIQ